MKVPDELEGAAYVALHAGVVVGGARSPFVGPLAVPVKREVRYNAVLGVQQHFEVSDVLEAQFARVAIWGRCRTAGCVNFLKARGDDDSDTTDKRVYNIQLAAACGSYPARDHGSYKT